METFGAEDVDFANAVPVVSAAHKFVLPVGLLRDAEPLVYPRGAENAGQQITDGEGKSIGTRGIVFFNPVDKCYQAAPADGQSVIVFNEVDFDGARLLMTVIHDCDEPASDLTRRSIARIIGFASEVIGLRDIYNSTDAYVRSQLVAIGDAPAGADRRPWGWMRRDQLGICHAVFVPGPSLFKGPAATLQQIAPEGAFILRQGSAFRMVEKSVLLRTYMNLDFSPLNVSAFDVSYP